jgi:rubrerythrin
MAKIAKLVYFMFVTRVVVEDTATDEEMIEASKPSMLEKVKNELSENLDMIQDDLEVPYNPSYQCGSCENEFEDLKMGKCPHCGSGNWVEGNIDE